jgi:chromosome segregation protein
MKLAEMEKELAVLAASLNQEQGDAARKLLGDELRGEVSEFLDIEPGWEQAVGAALSPVIDFLVAGQLPAAAAAGLQQSRPDLRFGFIVPSEQETAALMGPADGAIAGRLAARVKVKPGAPRLLEQTVEGCLVAESVDALPRLGERYRQWVFVTREGVARFPDGRVVVESRERNRLSIGRRAENVELQIADCRLQIERSEADGSRLAAERSGLEERLGRALVELGDAERERAALEATFDAAAAVRDELERDWERLRQERESVQSARRQSAERQARAEAGLAELVERMAAAEGALAQARAQAGESEQQVRNLLDVSAAALGEASEAGQVVSRLEAENAFAKRQIDEGRFRAGSLAQRADAARREVEQLETGMAGRRTEIEQAKLALEQAEEELARLAAGELGQAEEELEANIRELRHAQEQAQTLLLEQRLRLRELEQQCARIVEQARTDHGTDIEAYEPPPLEETAQRLSHIRHRLAELGPVNPLAGEEFARERGDLERLRSQRQDVAQAKANLEQTLSEIDQHAQGQFIATYGQVRGHFRDIFRELFLEGEADLVLVNDANPLESEIAITARPRGKNPKRLEQLSDGEKALLAVSLLFAFYRVKPAPFCFLDEVDAPLDDANVGRFADYLRRLADTTQVIIITHNRLTVERADIVFGVTAEQPGVSKLVSVSLEEYRTRAEGGTNDARSTASNAAVPA